jgi:hypothetical protein
MPPQQGLRLDKEAPSASSRQKPTQSRENCSIPRLQGRTRQLPTQDGDFMTEDHDFNGQVLLLPPRQTDQLKYADEGNVEEGERHAPSSLSGSRPRKYQVGGPAEVFGTHSITITLAPIKVAAEAE